MMVNSKDGMTPLHHWPQWRRTLLLSSGGGFLFHSLFNGWWCCLDTDETIIILTVNFSHSLRSTVRMMMEIHHYTMQQGMDTPTLSSTYWSEKNAVMRHVVERGDFVDAHHVTSNQGWEGLKGVCKNDTRRVCWGEKNTRSTITWMMTTIF